MAYLEEGNGDIAFPSAVSWPVACLRWAHSRCLEMSARWLSESQGWKKVHPPGEAQAVALRPARPSTTSDQPRSIGRPGLSTWSEWGQVRGSVLGLGARSPSLSAPSSQSCPPHSGYLLQEALCAFTVPVPSLTPFAHHGPTASAPRGGLCWLLPQPRVKVRPLLLTLTDQHLPAEAGLL